MADTIGSGNYRDAAESCRSTRIEVLPSSSLQESLVAYPYRDETIVVVARVAAQCGDVDVDRGDDHGGRRAGRGERPSGRFRGVVIDPVPVTATIGAR